MQIGGLGSSHGTEDHHVTKCIHDHHETRENKGVMAMKASVSGEISAARSELQQDGQFSLGEWLRNLLGTGRGFLPGFRGDSQAAGSAEGNMWAAGSGGSSQAAASQAVAHSDGSDLAATAAMTARQETQPHVINENGTFPAAESRKQTPWRKLRERFQALSERESGRLSQRASGSRTKNSFSAGRERPGENLHRHGRCRRDTVEVNMASLEDDYLMDSYDRRGEYSRLTTKQ